MADTALATAPGISITESAAHRVQALIRMEDRPGLKLRLSVSGGGCSGFQYGISLDDSVNDDDLLFTQFGVTVVVDETSLGLLGGSEVDYVEDLIGASFQIRNPNATSTCGCGSSFSM
ncbi:MAG: iron-sulfur cluster insertion protein ErpA [Magnetospirillum sp.]|nr:iron-sulfur cluster insertion protein ErpA [Magnetospirillum sp.]